MAIAEADYSMTESAFTQVSPRGLNEYGPQPGDEQLLVRFFKEVVEDPKRTKEEGRPMFMEVDFVQISQPGNRAMMIRRPASIKDKQRFPRHYEAYEKRNDNEYLDGTLLSEWPGVSRAQVEELAYFNIRTVEQLSLVADSNATNFRNLLTLKQKATAYLAVTKDNVAAEKINSQLAERDAKIQAQQEQIDELRAMMVLSTANQAYSSETVPAPMPEIPVIETTLPEAFTVSPDAITFDSDSTSPVPELDPVTDPDPVLVLAPDTGPKTPKTTGKRRRRGGTKE